MDWHNFVGIPTTPGFAGAAGMLFAVVVLWSIIWKGLALWKAAKKGSKVWFVFLLVVNTVGILEILYLYVFSRKSKQPIEAPKM
jgi:hypothetical protein